MNKEPIGVTQTIPPSADAMPVRNDPASDNDAFVVDTPYLLSDGKSREAPIPVVVVDADRWVDRAGNLRDVARFNISGLIPTLTVTGGVITPFNSGGTDYIEIAFASSGSFTLSAPVPNARWALGAGGGAGGRVSSSTTVASPAGAGGLRRSATSVTLPAGAYNVAIGAGAPAVTVAGGSTNGSDSVMTGPLGTITAVGGGKGASTGTGNTDGGNGGSGGGGRSTGATEGSTSVAGTGVAGQGFAGGLGFNSPTDANKASGGSGGAGSAGGNGALGVVGTAGAGVLLDWIATPRTVCAGQPGILATQTSATPDQTWGNGSQAAINAQVGKGGNGFAFIRVRAADVNVVMA